MNTPATSEDTRILSRTRQLPELPATVPAPEVTYSFSAWGHINTEVSIDGRQIIFWREALAEPVNSTLYTGDPNPWESFLPAEDLKAAMAWGEIMHDRVCAAAKDFLIGLSTPDFKTDLVAVARD